ncbi:MAG: SH3 domain-containing protein [Armatimonadia bacterium]
MRSLDITAIPRRHGVAMLTAIFVLVALTTQRAEAASPRPAWVIPETLNVRSGPRTDSKRIGSLPRGAKVYVISFANKWCWCAFPGGSKGWVAEWMLQFSQDKGRKLAASTGKSSSTQAVKGNPPAWIGVGAANVRSAPGLGGKSYGTLNSGDKVYVLGRQGDWVKCKTPGGSGWVRGDLLEYNISAGRKLSGTGSRTASKPATVTSRDSAKAYVIEDKVYLRSGPGSRFDKKASLVKGQTLYISGKSGQWRRATVHGGATGWVAAWLIKQETDKKPSSSSGTGATGAEVAKTDKVLPAWVTAASAKVRNRPSGESPVKFKVYQGKKLYVGAVSGHWCRVRTDSGNYGWVAGWLIKFVPPGKAITTVEAGEKVEVNVGWVARPVVNLRTGPSTDAATSGEAKLGTRLIIIGKKPDLYKVALEDGNIGWMSSRLVDTRAERQARQQVASARHSGGSSSSAGRTRIARATLAAPHDFPSPTDDDDVSDDTGGDGLGAALVATAKKYLGCAYVRGSSRAGAFDCSGFTSYVHRRHGIDISRSSRSQFYQGSPISRDDLQPGDVVFFENTYRAGISHVGMYIGKGKFIHAANRRGGVKITDLDSDYYARRYVGARRMY